MIIDLPLDALEECVKSTKLLDEKIKEGVQLLSVDVN